MNDNAKENILQCKNDLSKLAIRLGQLKTETEQIMVLYHEALSMDADRAFVTINPLADRVLALFDELTKLGAGRTDDDKLYGPLDDHGERAA